MTLRYDDTPARPLRESSVPMINVVFLLLIFFVMTASIVPPDEVEVAPPLSVTQAAAQDHDTLFVDASGGIHYARQTGAEALSALSSTAPARLLIRADQAAPAAVLAQVVSAATTAGISTVSIATGSR